MRPRPVLAVALALVLLLVGCGEQQRNSRQVSAPAPAVSTDPSAAGTPSPAARPTTRPKPRLRPTPKTLPAGLRRATGVRAVALTFDDGPDPTWTPKVLDQLRAARVKATFCVVGTQVRKHPQLVARIVREGHQLCNHSWRHDFDLGRRPVAEIRADLTRTNQAIRAAVPGAKVPFFRQPGGRWTPEVVTVARQLGMRSLHWSVDPQDWAKPTAPVLTKRIQAGVRPGAIVLMHDGGGDRSRTLAACGHLIADLKRRFGIAPPR
ncbi:polysaccharide deacetylase family protein [Micromonospora coxensis]|uniref:Peptidoglycan/xylan/chitin deacetylase, PgdA/CDA1 family n=1 Tax=Micromonospora coxensis TaxID=356852 RepID=A0A1C5IVU0_9ACTN|nr:polysaccharide deacetylase family protein [Micromonospora coxensis]SCG62079.1 Peptidoglycan/xylan/chitin deacetylase, PgdA/CDA1 family [Micromonospora coxensis]